MSSDAPALPARSRWALLVQLLLRRLARTPMGRFAFLGSAGLTVLALSWVVVLRVEDGDAAPIAAVPIRIANMAFWVAMAPVVLAAANTRLLADRKDGVEGLARTHGFAAGSIVRARVGAAALGAVLVMMVPTLVAGVASLGVSPSLAVLGERARVLVAVVAYALVSGSVGGALGAACDALSPRRGRSLLIAVLFVSWAAADVVGDPRLSITALLGLVLDQLLAWFGLGRIGV